ncbi:hypothetical protein K0M31_005979 [Melipona bicolor]|uniref:Uncharacterized protein n=1 Tax=Melipona bicolor TaxID=60889 RepID=A0AA40FSL1_9HYME|nr:hypothetical protein K0M31_005979 [Melipona bicolor]
MSLSGIERSPLSPNSGDRVHEALPDGGSSNKRVNNGGTFAMLWASIMGVDATETKQKTSSSPGRSPLSPNGDDRVHEASRQALPGGSSNDERESNGGTLVMLLPSIMGSFVMKTKAKTWTERSRDRGVNHDPKVAKQLEETMARSSEMKEFDEMMPDYERATLDFSRRSEMRKTRCFAYATTTRAGPRSQGNRYRSSLGVMVSNIIRIRSIFRR